MTRHKRILALSVSAGLAASATASGQLEIVNNLPGNFVDITATGTYINLGDDGFTDIATTAGNSVLAPGGPHRVTNNGAIAWNSLSGTAFTNQAIPSTALAGGNQALAVYWDDLYTYPAAMTPAEGVYHQTIGGTLYITWRVGHIIAANSTGEVQLQVFSSGPILAQFIYRQVDGYGAAQNNGATATIGYQNGSAGFNNVQYAFNTAGSVTNGTVLSLVFSGPSGACCLPSGACTISTSNGCAGASGIYRGDGTTCPANCPQPPTGACCFNNGTCQILWQGGCTSQGGTYRGDNSVCNATNCPTGACCLPNLTCSVTAAAGCAAQSGVYRGDGSVCAGNCPQAWAEQGDAGDLPAGAQVIGGTGGLPGIAGALGAAGDADMYRFRICDAAAFQANTLGTTTAFGDTQLFLFDTTGHGVTFNDDDPTGAGGLRSRLSSQFIPGNGEYFIAISSYNNDPQGDQTTGLIWINTPFNVERRPDGPAAGEAVGSWDGLGGGSGNYTIFLSGACYISQGPICYADCNGDHALNVNDFVCFQGLFAGGNLLADCNNDTLLNVNDFVCFQSAFAAGCSQL